MALKKIFVTLFTVLVLANLIGLTSCKLNQGKESKSELLQKTLAYHDPENNWPKLKARFYLTSTDTTGKTNSFELEIDNTIGYFAHISRKNGKEVIKGMAGGKAFYLLDGKKEISDADRKEYDLTSDAVKWVHQFHGYLYGLPMKLTDESAQPSDNPATEVFNGESYQVLQVTYDPTIGSDHWYFYLDPRTYAMQAYKFNHGKPESGEYILLEQEETVQGIKVPKVRKWYLNKNNRYLGTDTLVKTEPLTSSRNS
ncbi:DUF6503 family protein [Adhaeribacter aquaticus]|uniref:DUF6503 family protein n=1 Tax=Adhaeribacter aquaticus TaxID=299567 RepID=UPI000422DF42|nr:DUF6503 family protein [Adhaeribacter aquaticus]